MSQHWIVHLLQEHEEAIKRHQRYVAAHESIIRMLHAFEQEAMTEAQVVSQLEEVAASQAELGLAALYRQTIDRLRGQRGDRR